MKNKDAKLDELINFVRGERVSIWADGEMETGMICAYDIVLEKCSRLKTDNTIEKRLSKIGKDKPIKDTELWAQIKLMIGMAQDNSLPLAANWAVNMLTVRGKK